MRVDAPLISQHCLNRVHRWMLLWLTWFAAFLREARAFAPFSDQATAIAHQWLDHAERVLTNIILIRAAPQVRGMAPPKHATRRKTETQLRRAIIGSTMRRTLRARDLNQRIAALSQNIDALVARLLKRLPRGLTRRRPHHARPQPRPIVCTVAVTVAEAAFLADTS